MDRRTPTELDVRSAVPELRDVSELDFSEEDGLLVAHLAIPGCEARVVKLEAGSRIPLHRHTRPSVKLLVRGTIALAAADERIGDATPGTFYWCTGVPYRGDVLQDSFLLVIDQHGSERIMVGARSSADEHSEAGLADDLLAASRPGRTGTD